MRPVPILPLMRASHPGPTVAVTVLAILLAVGADAPLARLIPLGIAVLAGQLSIGWSNDLLDVERDRRVGRTDKPLVRGQLSNRAVKIAIAAALLCCVACTPFFGYGAALLHLVAVVGGGWVYNLVAKGMIISFIPYAVAFGSLPMVASLAADPPQQAPIWMLTAGALLGVGAHLANAMPDLAADAATGITGLPHRLGLRRLQVITPLLLTAATIVAVLGPGWPVPVLSWIGLVVALGLAVVAWRSRGKMSFRAVISIAVLNVIMLLIRG